MEKIDFVLLWVDGNDKKWQKEKNKYLPSVNKNNTATSSNRFRDWNILKYWFRGVEKYASWVNKIYFVTWGHLPKWLNTENDKLEIVKHDEFIPNEYLPTFNSNTIILNLHRIKGLSDKFVLFNDDMFIIKNTHESDFFQKNLPKDSFSFNVISPTGNMNDSFNHMRINNVNLINRYYNKKDIVKLNFKKLYNLKNGYSNNLKTLFLSNWSKITGFVDPHIPYSYDKKYFIKLWKLENELFNETCMHKFRDSSDITDWSIRYFQLCDGYFINRNVKFGSYFEIKNDNKNLINFIKKQKSEIVCINDVLDIQDFEKVSYELSQAFEELFPTKSKFEK